MIVPNYIPDPLEVPGNVTEQPYLQRVRFIRRTTGLFCLSVLSIGVVASIGLPRVGILPAAGSLGVALILLEIWRIFARGKPIEGKVSGASLPVVLTCWALLAQEMVAMDIPMWQCVAGPICASVYTMFSGRDYSFLGNFFLSLIFSSIAVAAVANSLDLQRWQSTFALASNAVVLGYFLYDLASLLSRRRLREEFAAVTDLYRDVFNFFGYFVRVVRHWHKHRILSLPSPTDRRFRARD